jgi:glycine/D-amino acid oxidase-like deaminating enzyme
MLLAFWQAAERLGARVIGHAPVTGIRVEGGEVTAVETPHGEIRTPLVVDSAGVWSRIVGRMAGADVPVQPVRHHLRITSPVAGVEAKQPVVRLIDAATYVRPARGGVMYGGFEQDPMPLDDETIGGDGFSMDRLPLDHAVNDRFRDAVLDEFPDLATATVQEQRGGMFTMTADGMFLVGPSDAARGLWVASGCNGSGFSLSPASAACWPSGSSAAPRPST